MSKDTSDVLEQLKRATEGLLFQSESDYPVEPFRLKADGKKSVESQDILKAGKHPAKAPVKKIKLDEFFGNATQEESWHGPEERETVKRFQELLKTLKENLTGIRVFKVGKVKSDVYVVGKAKSGDFLGVKTKVVET